MKARVLFVEDEPDIRLVIGQGLKFFDFDVTSVETAEEALKKLRIEKYDVILLDMGLPGMSGWEMAKRLQRGDYPHVPIIALTGASRIGDEQKAYQAGCAGYITKPCEPNTVKRKIEKILEKTRRF